MRLNSKNPITAAIRVRTANLRYSFGLPVARHERGPFTEYTSLECRGELEASRHMSALPIEATILARREYTRVLAAEGGKEEPHIAIGELSYRKDNPNCLLSLPFDSLLLIAPEIISGRITHLIFRGIKAGAGKMRLQSVSLDLAESLEDHGLGR